MNVVEVKSKGRVTIPADLRRRMGLREGDVMEATLVEDGILLRRGDAEERAAAVARLQSIFARVTPLPEDAGRSEEEVMEDIIADIKEYRRERRARSK